MLLSLYDTPARQPLSNICALEGRGHELGEEIGKVWDEWKEKAEAVEPFQVPLEKTDIRVEQPTLFWA